MGAYICEICGNLKDDDWDVPEEFKDGLICEYCAMELQQEKEYMEIDFEEDS